MRPFFLLTPVMLAAAAASAQPAPHRPMVSPACRQEIMQACPATPDAERGARMACMREKFPTLSQGCQGEIAAARAAREARRGEGAPPPDAPPPPETPPATPL